MDARIPGFGQKYEAIKQTINEAKESRRRAKRNAIKAKSNLSDKCENVSNVLARGGTGCSCVEAWLQLSWSSLPASWKSIKRNNICCALKTVDKMATTVGAAI